MLAARPAARPACAGPSIAPGCPGAWLFPQVPADTVAALHAEVLAPRFPGRMVAPPDVAAGVLALLPPELARVAPSTWPDRAHGCKVADLLAGEWEAVGLAGLSFVAGPNGVASAIGLHSDRTLPVDVRGARPWGEVLGGGVGRCLGTFLAYLPGPERVGPTVLCPEGPDAPAVTIEPVPGSGIAWLAPMLHRGTAPRPVGRILFARILFRPVVGG